MFYRFGFIFCHGFFSSYFNLFFLFFFFFFWGGECQFLDKLLIASFIIGIFGTILLSIISITNQNKGVIMQEEKKVIQVGNESLNDIANLQPNYQSKSLNNIANMKPTSTTNQNNSKTDKNTSDK
jgi:hypothetical protein